MSYTFLFFKQKTAYEMRVSDWSSDVCSSDLRDAVAVQAHAADAEAGARAEATDRHLQALRLVLAVARDHARHALQRFGQAQLWPCTTQVFGAHHVHRRRHQQRVVGLAGGGDDHTDRKSTRLNSSH